jgi:hypothetical protein
MAAGFGLTIGVGGTLALLSPHAEKSIIDKNEPASNLTMVEKAPPDEGEAFSAGTAPTKDVDIADTPGTLRQFSLARAQSAHCRDPFSSPDPACFFHRTRQTDVAAVPELDAPQAIGKVADDMPHQSERPAKAPVKQGKRLKPAMLSEHAYQYASPRLRYGDRNSLDRGGFW